MYPGKVTRAISDHSTYFELRRKKYNPNCVRVIPLWNISNCIFRERLKSIFFQLGREGRPRQGPQRHSATSQGPHLQLMERNWAEQDVARSDEVRRKMGVSCLNYFKWSSTRLEDPPTTPTILRDVLSGKVPNSFKKRSSFVLRLFCSVYICIVELP